MKRSFFRNNSILLGLVFLLAVVSLISLQLGSSFISFERMINILVGQGTKSDILIVTKLRLPRIILAINTGIALAVSGLLLQIVIKNPLASPSLFGVVDGAALGAIIFLVLFSSETGNLVFPVEWQPVAAFLGSLLAIFVVFWLTILDGRGLSRLILYGICFSALATALISLLMIIGPIHRASQAFLWLTGSVHAANWQKVVISSSALIITAPIMMLLSSSMKQLMLDEESAQATGLTVKTSLVLMVILATFLTAIAVSFAGAVGFVGLLAPHIARFFTPSHGLILLFITALTGALLVLGADFLGRIAFQPLQIPAGAITAFIGAPYFLFMLRFKNVFHRR